MSYLTLGQYAFTTAADYTGLNPGNLTSILNLSTIRVPNFELYQLLINTSQVPTAAAIPSLVQQTPIGKGTGTALALTFPAAVTKGNLVAAGIGGYGSAANPSPSAVTLGASADHFAVIATGPGPTENAPSLDIWADPDAQQASAAVAVTLSGGSGTQVSYGQAWEIASTLATSSAAASWDTWQTEWIDEDSGYSNLYLKTNALKSGNDFAVGFAMAQLETPAFSITPPQGWNNQVGATQFLSGASEYLAAMGSWQLPGTAGASVIYTAGAQNTAGKGLSAGITTSVVAFYPTATPPAAAPFPFTIAIDGRTWDQQQTVAGVGYTYNVGQSPLYLNPGQTMQILWDLPAAQYAGYAQQFQISAWFRYDPSIQS